jgi:DNA excision repair protein ERCC-1
LLVLVDDENNTSSIQELNTIAFRNDFTLILSWSNLEAARYIETIKLYEGKSSNSIKEKVESEFLPAITKSLTNISSVNKTDVVTLLDNFDNFHGICNASEQQLILCPGIGEKKVKRIYKTLHEPFHKKKPNNSKIINNENKSNLISSIETDLLSVINTGNITTINTNQSFDYDL